MIVKKCVIQKCRSTHPARTGMGAEDSRAFVCKWFHSARTISIDWLIVEAHHLADGF